uniref:DNA polymerase epsilon subunit 3 n=1 Tax=Meloidogyne floridensis TaxID=298350 RepID=A0A915NEZ1_9BILA
MEVTSDDLKFPKAIEAKNAIARSAAIFILHATSLANDNAHSKKRKNVTAEDVLYAVRQLECSELESPILEGLQIYRQKKDERLQLRKDRIASKKAADASQGSDKEKERKTDDEKEGEESDDDIIELDE